MFAFLKLPLDKQLTYKAPIRACMHKQKVTELGYIVAMSFSNNYSIGKAAICGIIVFVGNSLSPQHYLTEPYSHSLLLAKTSICYIVTSKEQSIS